MKKDELILLIHSLSKNEKRYVSQFSKLHEKGQNMQYKKIFGLLSKIPVDEYNEVEFRASHRKEPWEKHFPQKKKYLKDLILTAMRLYHRKSKVENELEDMLRDQAFLHERGVFNASLRLLNRSKKVALAHGCYRILLEINMRERKIILERKSKGVIDELVKAIEEGKQSLASILKETNRRELYERCFAEYRFGNSENRNRSIEYFAEAIDSEDRQSDPEDSFQAVMDLLLAKSIHARMRSSFEELRHIYSEIIVLWEGAEWMRNENQKSFIKVIANYANACYKLGLFPELKEQIERLEKLETKDFESQAERFQNLVHLKLLYLLNLHKIPEAEDLLESKSDDGIEVGLKFYGAKVNAARRLTITYNCFVLYFISEQYKKANHWLSRVFDESTGEARSDLITLARIFSPVFWYERGEIDLFESHLRSAKYKAKNNANLDDLERIVIEFLNKLKSKNGDSQLKEFAAWAKEELQNSYLKAGTESAPLGLEEFLLWLESKIQSTSILELRLGRNQTYQS